LKSKLSPRIKGENSPSSLAVNLLKKREGETTDDPKPKVLSISEVKKQILMLRQPNASIGHLL